MGRRLWPPSRRMVASGPSGSVASGTRRGSSRGPEHGSSAAVCPGTPPGRTGGPREPAVRRRLVLVRRPARGPRRRHPCGARPPRPRLPQASRRSPPPNPASVPPSAVPTSTPVVHPPATGTSAPIGRRVEVFAEADRASPSPDARGRDSRRLPRSTNQGWAWASASTVGLRRAFRLRSPANTEPRPNRPEEAGKAVVRGADRARGGRAPRVASGGTRADVGEELARRAAMVGDGRRRKSPDLRSRSVL